MAAVNDDLKVYYELQWKEKLNSDVAVRGAEFGGNKLRTYKKFKSSFSTEVYVSIPHQKKYRSAYAKFRCGVAPIKIETCRYGLNRLPVAQRLCESCNVIEDEFHVIMNCSMYVDIRSILIRSICTLTVDFLNKPQEEQFIELLSNPLYYKVVSKAMYNILNVRRYVVFS